MVHGSTSPRRGYQTYLLTRGAVVTSRYAHTSWLFPLRVSLSRHRLPSNTLLTRSFP